MRYPQALGLIALAQICLIDINWHRVSEFLLGLVPFIMEKEARLARRCLNPRVVAAGIPETPLLLSHVELVLYPVPKEATACPSEGTARLAIPLMLPRINAVVQIVIGQVTTLMHGPSGGFREGNVRLLNVEHVGIGRCLLVLRTSQVLCVGCLIVGVRGLDKILYA